MRCPAFLLLCALVTGSCAPGDAPDGPATVVVFAAASTTDVMREAGRLFEARSGIEVVQSFGGSASLARQIRAGAPADVYISADRLWMDDVEAAGAIRAGTRRDLLTNGLVLIAPAGAGFEVDFAATPPPIGRLAVGDPSHVPAGRYARQALEALNWWDALERNLIPTLDVRAALRLVEIGEADAGIVYSTDADRSDRVEVIGVLRSNLHEPIRYSVAQCTDTPAAAAFVEFLGTAEMTRVFEESGFRVLHGDDG